MRNATYLSPLKESELYKSFSAYSVPTIRPSSAQLTRSRGSNVTLTCTIESLDPLTEVRWEFIDLNNESWWVFEDQTVPSKVRGGTLEAPSLVLYDFQEKDIGQYHCLATNSYGMTRGARHLVKMLQGNGNCEAREWFGIYI